MRSSRFSNMLPAPVRSFVRQLLRTDARAQKAASAYAAAQKASEIAADIVVGALDPFEGADQLYSLSTSMIDVLPSADFELLFGFADFGDEEAMIEDPEGYGITDPRTRDQIASDIVARAHEVLRRWPARADP